MDDQKVIKSFRDLNVYQNTYKAMMDVMTKIVPALPENEKFDLKDQLSRSCKSIPRLIAEGYAKRHQKMGFQKYLDDAMAECNENIVSLEQCIDLYSKDVDTATCKKLVELYDVSGRQIYKLSEAWSKFKKREGFNT